MVRTEVAKALLSGLVVYFSVVVCSTGDSGDAPDGHRQDADPAHDVAPGRDLSGAGDDGRDTSAPRDSMAALDIASEPAWDVPGAADMASEDSRPNDAWEDLLDGLVHPVADVRAEAGPAPGDAAAPAGETSGSRIKRRFMVGTDGSRTAWGGLWDSGLGVSCGWQQVEDGTVLCVPSFVAYSSSYFADAACQQALATTSSAACGGQESPRFAFVSGAPGSCEWTYHVLGESFRPTSLYRGVNGVCSPVTGEQLSSLIASNEFYEVGALVPWTDFVEATLVLE